MGTVADIRISLETRALEDGDIPRNGTKGSREQEGTKSQGLGSSGSFRKRRNSDKVG